MKTMLLPNGKFIYFITRRMERENVLIVMKGRHLCVCRMRKRLGVVLEKKQNKLDDLK